MTNNSKVVNNAVDRAALIARTGEAMGNLSTAYKKMTELAPVVALYFKGLGISSDDVKNFAVENKAGRVVAGSKMELIKKFRDDVLACVESHHVEADSVRPYWQKLLSGIKAEYGIKTVKTASAPKTAEKDTAEKDTAEKETGYTPEKAAAQINQLIAWANGLESAEFNVTQFVAHLNKAVKEVTK